MRQVKELLNVQNIKWSAQDFRKRQKQEVEYCFNRDDIFDQLMKTNYLSMSKGARQILTPCLDSKILTLGKIIVNTSLADSFQDISNFS